MPTSTIARVAWDLPHGEEQVHWMVHDEVLYFGRSPECAIRFGHVPFDDRVPRVWGRLSWGGRVRVENLAERFARWSFSLHPVAAPEGPIDTPPCTVAPGMEASLPSAQFEVRAAAPGGLAITYTIRVTAFPRSKLDLPDGDRRSFVELVLTQPERRVGRALIRPLTGDQILPATYEQIARDTHYSRDGARDAIGRIDAKFVVAGLYPPGAGGTAPARVAHVLLKHPSLLS